MLMRMGALTGLATLTVLTACAPRDKGKEEANASAQDSRPAVTANATAAPNGSTDDADTPASSPLPALSRYVGKYPDDRIDGIDFLHHPLVVQAVHAAAGDDALEDHILSGNGDTGPIIESRGRLYIRYNRRNTGGSINWALLISEDGKKAAICDATADPVPDVSGADWYVDGAKAFTLYMPCPYEASDLEEATGNWPIGPMVG